MPPVSAFSPCNWPLALLTLKVAKTRTKNIANVIGKRMRLLALGDAFHKVKWPDMDDQAASFQFSVSRLLFSVTLICVGLGLFLTPEPRIGATDLDQLIYWSRKLFAVATSGFAIGNLIGRPILWSVLFLVSFVVGGFAFAWLVWALFRA
jgi:hypothetical protein